MARKPFRIDIPFERKYISRAYMRLIYEHAAREGIPRKLYDAPLVDLALAVKRKSTVDWEAVEDALNLKTEIGKEILFTDGTPVPEEPAEPHPESYLA